MDRLRRIAEGGGTAVVSAEADWAFRGRRWERRRCNIEPKRTVRRERVGGGGLGCMMRYKEGGDEEDGERRIGEGGREI